MNFCPALGQERKATTPNSPPGSSRILALVWSVDPFERPVALSERGLAVRDSCRRPRFLAAGLLAPRPPLQRQIDPPLGGKPTDIAARIESSQRGFLLSANTASIISGSSRALRSKATSPNKSAA